MAEVTIIDFSGHKLTEEQSKQLEALTGHKVKEVVWRPAKFNAQTSFVEQATALVDSVGWTPEDWQSSPFIVNLPGMSTIAGAVLAEIHGRTGYFPVIVRLVRDEANQFVVKEVMNLQAIREASRNRRFE